MRRYVTFSLRFFILVITTLCFALALYPRDAIEEFGKQTEAASALRAIRGVQLETSPLPDNGYTWLLSWFIPPTELNHVTTVRAERSGIKDEDLLWLTNLPYVKRLYLASNYGITDEGMEHIAGCDRLQRISLWYTKITDKGLHVLREKEHLQVVDISIPTYSIGSTNVTPGCLEHFAGLPNLKILKFNFPVGPKELELLATIPRYSPSSLKVEAPSDYSIDIISRWKSLKQLTIEYGNFISLIPLMRLPNLEHLTLKGQTIDDQHLAGLNELVKLKSLTLQETSATNWIVKRLRFHPSLKSVHSRGSNINCDVTQYLEGASFRINSFCYDGDAIRTLKKTDNPSAFTRCILSVEELPLLEGASSGYLTVEDFSQQDSLPAGIDAQPNAQPWTDEDVAKVLPRLDVKSIQLKSDQIGFDCLNGFSDFQNSTLSDIRFSERFKLETLISKPNPNITKLMTYGTRVSVFLGPTASLDFYSAGSHRNRLIAHGNLPGKASFNLSCLQYLPNLQSIELGCERSLEFDGDFSHVKWVPKLKRLIIDPDDRKMGLESLKQISQLPQLEQLKCTLAQDESFHTFDGELPFKSLEDLNLLCAPGAETLLPMLCQNPRLSKLKFECYPPKFKLLKSHVANFDQLKNLKRLEMSGLDDTTLEYICKHAKKLQYINLKGNFTAASLNALATLPDLNRMESPRGDTSHPPGKTWNRLRTRYH